MSSPTQTSSSSSERAISQLSVEQSANAFRSIFPLTATQFVASPTPDAASYIAYEDTGDIGENLPVLFFVPGMGELRQTYRFIAPHFNREGHRVLCMDLRGAGQSTANFTNYTPEDVVTDMIRVLDHAQIKSPIVIIGNSLAGASANIFASKYPEKVQNIILINGIVRDMPADKFFRPASRLLFLPIWGTTVWLTYWHTLFPDPSQKPADFEIYATALKKNLYESGRLYALKMYAQATKEPAWECATQVTCPVLTIYGSKDPDYPDPAGEPEIVRPRYAKAKSFKSVVLDGLGHYPHVEDPQKVIKLISEFLS
ncbi:10825_t:CDS:2 [Ambispora gerdemannii]|uniref:10825_t:CDS:1 n=1 Tax=Ambispora gerdemannii TaxID=144530 RepID=A0A9N9BJ71_9GLOM|nr:10825_t:CDS:2 [Ambispora gerdemannii]